MAGACARATGAGSAGNNKPASSNINNGKPNKRAAVFLRFIANSYLVGHSVRACLYTDPER